MNISQAKDMIRDTVRIYLKKNEFGEYVIPYMKQRPIYMLGAPGIGKTAILEQVAKEFQIPVVTFSMTHMTKENAVGLPMVKRIPFGDRYQEVTDYTVSEIIAAVYRVILDSGKSEGILFLDEINCVTDSLAPFMLLFLQYKRFGNKELPPGWVIVAAGNPKEYNYAARDFELAIKDRLKFISVEPDVKVWLSYARKSLVHPAILAYLAVHGEQFYVLKNDGENLQYVTARGWEDLSKVLFLYEDEALPVTLALIRQYITVLDVSEAFFEFYRVSRRYAERGYYEMIFSGYTSISGLNMKSLSYEYRLALLSGLVSEIAVSRLKVYYEEEHHSILGDVIDYFGSAAYEVGALMALEKKRLQLEETMKQEQAGGNLKTERRHALMAVISELNDCKKAFAQEKRPDEARVRSRLEMEQKGVEQQMNADIKRIQNMTDRSIDFIAENWPDSPESEYFRQEMQSL